MLQLVRIEDSWLQSGQEGPMEVHMAAQLQLVQQLANRNQPVVHGHESGGSLSRQPSNAPHPGDGRRSTSNDVASSDGSSVDLQQADVASVRRPTDLLPQDIFRGR